MKNRLKNTNVKIPRIALHIAFWALYLAFFVIQWGLHDDNPDYQRLILQLSLTMPVDIAAAYFTVYVLMQHFLLRKKYVLFTVSVLLSAGVFIIIQRIILFYITYPTWYPDSPSFQNMTFWGINPFSSFINIYTVVGLFAAIKLLKYWYEDQRIRSELENQNKTSEIALLRSQVNPHFLFNTLNNIDTLISRNQDMASDAIMKLSDIMRYMLYDASTDKVMLEQEIEYIQSYIALQLLRVKDQNFVKFTIKGEYKSKLVAPMLFIPFVENAFKHGLKSVPSPGIEMLLEVSKQGIFFELENYFIDQGDKSKDESSGIGLANVRRRLDLIYPDKYELTISSGQGKYKTTLKLME